MEILIILLFVIVFPGLFVFSVSLLYKINEKKGNNYLVVMISNTNKMFGDMKVMY